MTRQPHSRKHPPDYKLPPYFPGPQLQQNCAASKTVTVAARVRRLPPNASDFDLESSARRVIGSLIKRLRDAGGDPERITRTRICVSDAAHGAVLAAVRDEVLHPQFAIHSIFLMNDESEDAFVTEIDAVRFAS